MKKIICGKEYDTECAVLLKKEVYGEFGDVSGYEESLYQSEAGYYFMYYNGGAESAHPKEDIKRISKAKAELFLASEA